MNEILIAIVLCVWGICAAVIIVKVAQMIFANIITKKVIKLKEDDYGKL